MSATADDALVLEELLHTPTTPVAAAELALRLRINERRVSSSLGRLRRRNLVNRKKAVCAHCKGSATLTTWLPARDAVGLLERPDVGEGPDGAAA